MEQIKLLHLVLLAAARFNLIFKCLGNSLHSRKHKNKRQSSNNDVTPTPQSPHHKLSAFHVILTGNERAQTHLFDDVFNDPIHCFFFPVAIVMTRNSNESCSVALGTAKPIALAHEII